MLNMFGIRIMYSYRTSLASGIVKDKFNNLQYCIESCVNSPDIDTCITQLSDIIDDVVSPIICKRVTTDFTRQQRCMNIEDGLLQNGMKQEVLNDTYAPRRLLLKRVFDRRVINMYQVVC